MKTAQIVNHDARGIRFRLSHALKGHSPAPAYYITVYGDKARLWCCADHVGRPIGPFAICQQFTYAGLLRNLGYAYIPAL